MLRTTAPVTPTEVGEEVWDRRNGPREPGKESSVQ